MQMAVVISLRAWRMGVALNT